MNDLPQVSVIVPTRAAKEREGLIRRAISSILDQQGVRATPIVVVNGPGCTGPLARELAANPVIRLVTCPEADLPGAIRAGREKVDTPWFAELDDDDLLLPNALATRIKAANEGDPVDVVVTNGIRRTPSGDLVHIDDPESVQRDPTRALLRANWLLPGSWICRTEAAPPEFFAGMPRHLECTYLALRFGMMPRFRFLGTPTVVWHTESPGSASKSLAYVLGQPEALSRLLHLPMPADVRDVLRARIPIAYLTAGRRYLQEGKLTEAVRWQLLALKRPDRWGHHGIVRRILGDWWRYVRA